LKTLDLSFNILGNDTILQFISALQYNLTLLFLGLRFVYKRPVNMPLKKERKKILENLLDRNRVHQKALVYNWGRVSVLTAFMRENQNDPIKHSIFPLLDIIDEFAGHEKAKPISLNKFMGTQYYLSHMPKKSLESGSRQDDVARKKSIF
jgi:hypothetical protein